MKFEVAKELACAVYINNIARAGTLASTSKWVCQAHDDPAGTLRFPPDFFTFQLWGNLEHDATTAGSTLDKARACSGVAAFACGAEDVSAGINDQAVILGLCSVGKSLEAIQDRFRKLALRVGRQLVDDATTEIGWGSTLSAGASTEVNGTVEGPIGIDREPVEGKYAVGADCGVAEDKRVDDTLLHTAAGLGRYLEDHAVTLAAIRGCAIEVARLIDYQVGVGIETRARSGEHKECALGIRSIRVRRQFKDSAVPVAASLSGSPEIARAIKNKSSDRIPAIRIAFRSGETVNHALGVRSISVRRQLEHTAATVIAEGTVHPTATTRVRCAIQISGCIGNQVGLGIASIVVPRIKPVEAVKNGFLVLSAGGWGKPVNHTTSCVAAGRRGPINIAGAIHDRSAEGIASVRKPCEGVEAAIGESAVAVLG